MTQTQTPAQPHRRFNPLTGEWILVAPHRTSRPWSGQQEDVDQIERPDYDPSCYLCPGNKRAGGVENPGYSSTYVFDNDFAALLPGTKGQADPGSDDPLFRSQPESGICRVICYSPRHNLSMSRMSTLEGTEIVGVWMDEYNDLASRQEIAYVQIFENRGLQMGCSNPHPHGQIWATSSIPDLIDRECRHQQEFLDSHGDCLLCSYLEREEKYGERLILSNESFVCLIPYWAVWPYETMILPRFHATNILGLELKQRQNLAEILIRLSIRYDNLFRTPFPLSMGIHQAPCDGGEYPGFHFHMHFYPPLLRSATVRKHMVGYELLAMSQRDITAEAAADTLRNLSDMHYLEDKK